MRKYTIERIRRIEKIKDELDTRIYTLFNAYCKAYNINIAYGIDEWRLTRDNNISIIQDTSYSGGRDTDHHLIPAEYLNITEVELNIALNRDAEKSRLKKKLDEQAAIQKIKEEKERKEMAEFIRLKNIYESKNEQ